MSFKGVIFDLDGTLVDSIEDLADSMNRVLLKKGFPLHPVSAYLKFVGEGIKNLVSAALPEKARDEQTVADCYALMVEDYGAHCLDKSQAYDGISILLSEVRARGLKVAVLTNKVDELAQKVVSHFFPAQTFDMVVGVSERIARKPDPAGALFISRELGIAPDEFIYVGDSEVDMQTATRAGMYPVGALWGFRSKKELMANGAKALIEIPIGLVRFLNQLGIV